jgi:uncharacterized protein (TIGR02266 family)
LVDETQRRVKVVSLKVSYKSATIEEFIDRHAPDVGRNGIYIRTTQPFPNGTLLRLQIQVANGQVVIAALGSVAWTRDGLSETSRRPAGMGVCFVKTDEASDKLIDDLTRRRADAGLAYEEGFRSTTSSSAPPPPPNSMFPPTNKHAPGPEEPTVVSRMEDIVDEATAPRNRWRKTTLMGIQPLPDAGGARESAPDEPTLIRKVPEGLEQLPELREEPPREPAPSKVDFTCPVLIEDIRFDALRRAAEPPAPSVRARRATAGVREIVGALMVLTVAFAFAGDRSRRRPRAPEPSPNVTTAATASEARPSPISAPPAASREQPPAATPSPEPAATSELATPDASPPVAPRTGPPLIPRANVVRKKPPAATTSATGLSKPKWLLKPAKADNPY